MAVRPRPDTNVEEEEEENGDTSAYKLDSEEVKRQDWIVKLDVKLSQVQVILNTLVQ